MNCHRIKSSGRPAGRLHSLFCTECRVSQRTDDLLSFGVVQLRKETNPHPALNRTLAVLALPQLPENFYLRLRRRSQRRTRTSMALGLFLGVSAWFIYMDALPAYLPYEKPAEKSVGQMALQFAIPANSTGYTVRGTTFVLGGATNELIGCTRALEFPSDSHFHPEADTMAVCLNYIGNKTAIETIHANLTTPYREQIWHNEQDWLDSYMPLQYFGALLHANAVWKESQGDRLGAIKEAQNLIAFGENISGGGSWNSRQLGDRCEQDGCRLLWRQLPGLSAKEALPIARRLEATSRLHKPLETTAQWERVSSLSVEYAALRRPFWRWQCSEKRAYSEVYPIAALQHLALAISLHARSNQHIFQDLNDAAVKEDQRFFGSYRHMTKEKSSEISRLDPLQSILRPSLLWEQADLDNICFMDFESETQNALLTTALAIQAYRQEHGVNPLSLHVLCPKYLSHVPADPFQPGAELHYAPQYLYNDQSRFEVTAQEARRYPTYVLYSVGPDGIDQQGKSIYLAAKGQNSRRVFPDSTGDIVAGINR